MGGYRKDRTRFFLEELGDRTRDNRKFQQGMFQLDIRKDLHYWGGSDVGISSLKRLRYLHTWRYSGLN